MAGRKVWTGWRKVCYKLHNEKRMTASSTLVSKKALWTGYILSALPVLLLLMSGVMKVMRAGPVVEGFTKFGFANSLIVPIGILELTCTVIYLIPRTSVLGAILLTGYLGGATVTNLRADQPVLIPVLAGVLVWGGLFMRDLRIRALIPWRQ